MGLIDSDRSGESSWLCLILTELTGKEMKRFPFESLTESSTPSSVVEITRGALLMGLPGEAHDGWLKRTCGMGLLGSWFEYMAEAHVRKLDQQGRVRRSSNLTRVYLLRPGCLYKAREGAVVG